MNVTSSTGSFTILNLTKFQVVVITLAALFIFTAWRPALSSEVTVNSQELTYSVLYGKKNVGKIFISIIRQDGGFQLISTTKPGKLASLVLKEHTSESEFEWQNGELVPLSAEEKLKGKESYERGYSFDYESMTIELNDGKSASFNEGDNFESVTFPLLLMHRDLAEIADTEVFEVSAKRIRSYTYQKPIEESIKVPAGEFNSLKITRHRTDRPEDTVTTWLDRSDNPIPVKIAIDKDGKITTLNLDKN